MTVSPIPALPDMDGKTTAVFGSYVLASTAAGQEVLRDRWVILEGDRIAAVSESRPNQADLVIDRPGRFVLPGLMNLHNHCFSEAIAAATPRTASASGTIRALSIRCFCPFRRPDWTS